MTTLKKLRTWNHKVEEIIFKHGICFHLRVFQDLADDQPTNLGLYRVYPDTRVERINVYFLDSYSKMYGNLFGRILMDKQIDNDIKQYLREKGL